MYEEDIVKWNFTRFLKIVEQKKQTLQNQVRQQQIQEKKALWDNGYYQMKMQDRELIEKEGVFELMKKKTVDKKYLQVYSELLDQDFANNKIQVASYIGNLI